MAVIVDCCAGEKFFSVLDEMNIKYYKSHATDYLSSPVNTHPDMQIHFVADKIAVVAPSVFDYYKDILPDCVTLLKGKKEPGRTYPKDVAYNVAKLGKKVIGNLEFVDDVIKEIYSDLGFEFINTKQGYTKCNLCIVNEQSVITEDDGLYVLLSGMGISVLKISVGSVNLKSFDYGFIGGASGLIRKDSLAFFGDLSKVSNGEKVRDFLKDRGVEPISLSGGYLEDFGSILYFEE